MKPHESRKHVWLMMSAREHTELKEAAGRMNISVAELCRQAVTAYLVSDMTYYYIEMPDGTISPPATEVGYREFALARRVAAKRGGRVVVRQWVPAEEPVNV